MSRRLPLNHLSSNTSGGFSLVETLIATSLAMVLALAGVLHVASTRRHSRLLNETHSFRLFLERVYAHACSYQKIVTVTLSESGASAFHDETKAWLNHTIRAGVSLRFDEGQSRRLIIYPSLSSSPATLHFTGGSGECSLIISLRSRFRVEC